MGIPRNRLWSRRGCRWCFRCIWTNRCIRSRMLHPPLMGDMRRRVENWESSRHCQRRWIEILVELIVREVRRYGLLVERLSRSRRLTSVNLAESHTNESIGFIRDKWRRDSVGKFNCLASDCSLTNLNGICAYSATGSRSIGILDAPGVTWEILECGTLAWGVAKALC